VSELSNKPKMRVAALQFATTVDVAQNLATCLRMIDTAAVGTPNLMVLGEFSNHLSWYDGADHAWSVAVDLESDFLTAIAAKAKEHSCYIDINVTLRRAKPAITVTSLLYSPEGVLIAEANKQTLMGHENIFFERATTTSPIIETPFGNLGLFPCRDGVTFETPRGLALRGAQLFCDSLNSFALDEASLHVPARAPENKCFLISANKVGPLIPEALLEPVSEATHIPIKYLMGAGGSQIVSPTGQILAIGPKSKEAIITAEIDLTEADNKARPDETHIFAIRRPELYEDITIKPTGAICAPAAEAVEVATLNVDSLDDLSVVVELLPSDVTLAVLPALWSQADADADTIINALRRVCAERALHIVTSVRDQSSHKVVMVNEDGIVAEQQQLHGSVRWNWAEEGNTLTIIDLPWGKVAMLNSDDAAIPEIVKVAALKGIHCLVVVGDFQEPWETRFGIPSRAAENRICVVAAGHQNLPGMICSLERDFTILTPWAERKFDGKINQPLITHQNYADAFTAASIHPNAASNKLMSENTDLLTDRPWFLSHDLTDPKLG